MLFALVVATLASRPILVVNAGDDAIFSVRVGHAEQSAWGDDVLGFAEVIDVSRGRVVRIPFDPSACTGDVAATYRDGTVVVRRDVNLCTVTRIDFESEAP